MTPEQRAEQVFPKGVAYMGSIQPARDRIAEQIRQAVAEEREALLARFRGLHLDHESEAMRAGTDDAALHFAKAEAYDNAVKIIEARARGQS